MKLLDRFLRYIAIDTQSCPKSLSSPSTLKQLDLQRLLEEELRAIGLQDVLLDEFGYLSATIEASEGCETAPTIAFLAHVDTSPEVSGKGVQAQIVSDYKGGDIPLPNGDFIREKDYSELNLLKGHTIITSGGDTLLGADNKAGVAIIVSAAKRLLQDKDCKHPKIRIAFTPDEEIGRGVDNFDVAKFGADFAYTVDGGAEGEIEAENFNAAGAKIRIKGHNHHPGSAKGRMRNAAEIATELNNLLPANERPQNTEGYEGFFHLCSLNAKVESAEMEYIIRDHSSTKFEARKKMLQSAVDLLSLKYGEQTFELEIKDQYLNMSKIIDAHPKVMSIVEEAIRNIGITPIKRPIRGGTDGARLSYMGLPCPNIFTGGANFHSRHEYCSLDTMERSVYVLIEIAKLWSTEK